jgi:hypothetical protein
MRDYAVVKPQFWTGETGRRLRNKGPEALLVGMYLMTCPNSTMLGLFYLPLVTIAHETGLTLEGARKGLQGAAEVDFARYDPASETVWVLEMATYQVAETLKPRDRRWTGVVRELATWRKSPFFADFVARYKVPYNLPDNLAAEPLASPLEAPCKPLRSQDQDHEQDQEQEQDQLPLTPPLGVVEVGELDPAPARPEAPPQPEPVRVNGVDALAAIQAAAGSRLASGKRAISTTGLPQGERKGSERAWLSAWRELGAGYTLADCKRLGEWIKAGGWGFVGATVSAAFLTEHLSDGLQRALAWDGSPLGGKARASPEARPKSMVRP